MELPVVYLHQSPTILGEIESEIIIIPDNIAQEELPAAIAPPEKIKPCDLLDDFDDFVSANASPLPQEAFHATSSALSKLQKRSRCRRMDNCYQKGI